MVRCKGGGYSSWFAPGRIDQRRHRLGVVTRPENGTMTGEREANYCPVNITTLVFADRSLICNAA
jgi:hypothetical protein